MNFNHLMEAKFVKQKCKKSNAECYWIPQGNIRSTHGNNVHMTMYCKHCARREDIFLSETLYKRQQKILDEEVGNV